MLCGTDLAEISSGWGAHLEPPHYRVAAVRLSRWLAVRVPILGTNVSALQVSLLDTSYPLCQHTYDIHTSSPTQGGMKTKKGVPLKGGTGEMAGAGAPGPQDLLVG